MTGTAKTEEDEFRRSTAVVLVMPTNEAVIRKDYEDVVFRTVEGKFTSVVEEITEVHASGQPSSWAR